MPPGTSTSLFADLNDNGVFDAFREPYATAADSPGDAYNGYFKIGVGDLPAGQPFTIRPFVSSPGVVAFGEPRVAGIGANEFRQGPGVGYVSAGANKGIASGVVYSDHNNSGLYEGYPYDSRAGNFAVYADLNNNGVRDRGEPTTQTGLPGERGDPAGGEYTLYDLPTGQPVTIRLLGPLDPNASLKPTQTSRTVTIAGANGAVSNVDFRFATSNDPVAATLSGTVFNDANKNGAQDAGDAGVAGKTVFADYNGNGVVDSGEPSVVTQSDGTYVLRGVKSDNSSVGLRLAGVAAASVVKPGGGVYYARYKGNDVRSGLNFALVPQSTPATATLTGRVYFDANHNGSFDAGEGDNFGFTVVADLNGNGQPDAGEPSATHATVGSDGLYSLSGVPTGSPVTVRASADLDEGKVWKGWNSAFFPTMTVRPTAATVTLADLVRSDEAGRIALSDRTVSTTDVWLDLNGDRIHGAGEPSLVYQSPGLGDESGVSRSDYAIAAPYGTFTVAARFSGDADQYADFTASATTSASDRVAVVTITTRPTSKTGTVSGTAYDDADGDGTRDADEAALAGRTVFADYDYDGVVDAGEPTATTDAAGRYSISIPADSRSFSLRLSGLASDQIAQTYSMRMFDPISLTGRDFGVRRIYPTVATITGMIYGDQNANGARDGGEPGLPALGSIPEVIVYADYNGNGSRDDNEPAAVPGDGGSYSLQAAFGSYSVRVGYQFGTHYSVTQPANNGGGYPVTVSKTDATRTGLNFGLTEQYAPHVKGVVFADANGNGVRDGGEAAIAGATVFADDRNNGFNDENAPNYIQDDYVVTGGDGTFDFAVNINREFVLKAFRSAAGGTVSSPQSYTITLPANGSRTGLQFGFPA